MLAIRRFPIPLFTASAPRTGNLTIATRPAGSDVLIDGERRGATPLTLALTPGAHTVIIRSGSDERVVPLTIASGAEVTQYYEMKAAEPAALVGRLSVVTDPPGARVTVDGRPRGISPVTVADLTAEDHKVSVTNDAGSVERTVAIAAGSTASVMFSLPKVSGPVGGWLSISAPFDVEVRGERGCHRHERHESHHAGGRPPRHRAHEPQPRVSGGAQNRGGGGEDDRHSSRSSESVRQRECEALGRDRAGWHQRRPDADREPERGRRPARDGVPAPAARRTETDHRGERERAESNRRGPHQVTFSRQGHLMRAIVIVGIVLVAAGAGLGAQDSLSAAKDLYASAAYEDALSTLSRLDGATAPDIARQVDEYRAFCLYALGRTREAESVAESIIRKEPLARLDAADASPRLELMFTDVRKRLLPSLIRERFRVARSALDLKSFAVAEPLLAEARLMIAEAEKIGVKDEGLGGLERPGRRIPPADPIRGGSTAVTQPAVAASVATAAPTAAPRPAAASPTPAAATRPAAASPTPAAATRPVAAHRAAGRHSSGRAHRRRARATAQRPRASTLSPTRASPLR